MLLVIAADGSIDTAAGGVVDERVKSVPESIADVDHIGVGEVDRNVAVGMCRRVMPEDDARVVLAHFVVHGEGRLR